MNGEVRLGLRGVTLDLPVHGAGTRSLYGALMQRGAAGRLGGYGRAVAVRALDDVSLSFESGDRVALVGGNGAGKTTLLRVLAGVFEPQSGEVWRSGRVSALLDVLLGLDRDATGRENIVTCGLLGGVPADEVRERAEEAGAFAELGSYLDLPVRTYSAGMRFRLGFAAWTSFEPDVLLVDEWMATGDRQFLAKAHRRIESLAEGAGIVVLVSQDLHLVRRACSEAVLLNAGRVCASGPVDQVLDDWAAATAEAGRGG